MASYSVNQAAVVRASKLIDSRQYALDSNWGDVQRHFDLRLEEGGVLRSWAVPRGLPDDPGENRLAIAVADHAMDHLAYVDALLHLTKEQAEGLLTT